MRFLRAFVVELIRVLIALLVLGAGLLVVVGVEHILGEDASNWTIYSLFALLFALGVYANFRDSKGKS